MEIKRTVSIYFSPTDGTRRVVRAVSQGLNAPDSLELDRTSFESRWTGAQLRVFFSVHRIPVWRSGVMR